MLKLNGIKIDVTMFPDKTSQVWNVQEDVFECNKFNIEWDFSHEGEIMHLVQLVELLKYGRVPRPINLHIPYLPYGRQDKDVSNDTTFALKSLCRILHMLKFDGVTTLDAHSMRAGEYLCNFKNVHPSLEISKALDAVGATAVAFPDAGACDRYATKGEFGTRGIIIGDKVRNQKTGYIESYKITGNPKGETVLIVDDICDGGMTFKLLARDLLAAGSKEVHLYVTHGIFSKGLDTLKESGIGRFFTYKGECFTHKTGAGKVVVTGKPRSPKGMIDSETSNM